MWAPCEGDKKKVEMKIWVPKEKKNTGTASKVCSQPPSNSSLVINIDHSGWNDVVYWHKEKGFFFKWVGEWLGLGRVKQWCAQSWNCKVEIKPLPNAFYLAICETRVDKTWILLNGPYMMGGMGFFLNEWEPNLNPLQEKIGEVPMWTRLYNIPFEFWDMYTLQAIGNKLGKFIQAAEGVESKDFSLYYRICVRRNISNPLPKEIELCTNVGEVEEMVERYNICKSFGHTDLECYKDEKGKLGFSEVYLNKVIEMALCREVVSEDKKELERGFVATQEDCMGKHFGDNEECNPTGFFCRDDELLRDQFGQSFIVGQQV
ncbi:uncharacterized protein LOC131859923 [Cryptomeria japonica]|uniref:uncharacterized protein LOC131859923 n=1 Tax=Cryptomeria japonica TaxID=3369 RepID=UPI0027DA701E|nr:uncharacterized protein LOC131859923 [Cryptomeria japonica]